MGDRKRIIRDRAEAGPFRVRSLSSNTSRVLVSLNDAVTAVALESNDDAMARPPLEDGLAFAEQGAMMAHAGRIGAARGNADRDIVLAARAWMAYPEDNRNRLGTTIATSVCAGISRGTNDESTKDHEHSRHDGLHTHHQSPSIKNKGWGRWVALTSPCQLS